MRDVGYYNGAMGPLEEMQIPMLDRAVYFGDGCYEATTYANRRAFALEEHFDRFYNSCRLLDIPFHLTREELQGELQRCIDACDGDHGILYWQCSRGTAKRSHAYSKLHLTPNLLAFVGPYERTPWEARYRLLSREDLRFYYCNIKTLNLVPNILATDACEEAGCQETVFYRQSFGQKRVTEGAHSNLLLLRDGVLIAPPQDNLILPGITLRHLLRFARELGIPVAERPFTLEELAAADEIIVSSSGSLCIPACELDGAPIGGKDPATLRRLQEHYRDYYDRSVGLR